MQGVIIEGRVKVCRSRPAKSVLNLIVLDVRMPEMNGFQLLELMRKYPKAAAILVVMLSALSQPENIDRASSWGWLIMCEAS